ncbi:hypothetical protein UFOVP276_117 [uncultured Caudovirales phage]|uniref:Uncharacterized protein n=1 Tax=uncultured Caudovirales phage TaxID=2100421 RepID=A0A6J5LLR3_9CAUD|nr:hypothetical protein UFOVP127_11 [uncultured Caudovirales phage]CAB4135161.1 hypothetical protein UFOVP276_117 [uncultured Caudovirales phage]
MASPETVSIIVIDQDATPVADVLVRVFDSTGTSFITQQYSVLVGDNAVAEFTLDGDIAPISYTIRLSKTGVAFDGSLGDSSKSPQSISVYSPPGVGTQNVFSVTCETFVRPTAPDMFICRCSGFFKDITGNPLVGLPIRFINEFGPTVVGGAAILGEGIDMQTDKYGYMSIDLYRKGLYMAWITSVQTADNDSEHAIGFPRYMMVPDQSSADLPTLMFPVVNNVTVTPNPINLSVDQNIIPDVVVTSDDGRTLTGTACDDVYYDIVDKTIASLSVQLDKLTILGVQTGTTQLTAVRKDQSIVKMPIVPILNPVTITVT